MKPLSHVSALRISPTQPSVEILHAIGKLVFVELHGERLPHGCLERIREDCLEMPLSILLELHDESFPRLLQCDNPRPLTEPARNARRRLLSDLDLDPDKPDVVAAATLPDGIGDKFVESMRVLARLFAQATNGHTTTRNNRIDSLNATGLYALTDDGWMAGRPRIHHIG